MVDIVYKVVPRFYPIALSLDIAKRAKILI